jgi:AcrR family transcriptional regulator
MQLALQDLILDPVPEKNPFHRRDDEQQPPQQQQQQKPEIFKQSAPAQTESQREVSKTGIIRDEIAKNAARDEEESPSSFRKGRPRSEKSRSAILKATNSLLLHTSVQELSIEAIAKKAKVGKTTIYRWWPNKTAIVMEALSNQPCMKEPMPAAANNAEALRLQLQKLIRLLHSKNGETIVQLFSEAQADEESQRIFENSFLGPLMDAIEYSIEQGKETGEFREKVDTKLALDLLCGPIFFRLMAHPANFGQEFEESFPKLAVGLITV